MKNVIKKIIEKLPYVKAIKAEKDYFQEQLNQLHVPPGHYYSPTISQSELKLKEQEIWKKKDPELLGLDLNVKGQLELLNDLLPFYKDLPFSRTKNEELRYFYENEMYSYSDAIFLYSMIRHFKPKKIIEIGSGFSSAVILDTNTQFFDDNINCTFIEPYPERLKSLLRTSDNIDLIIQPVQDVELELFESLDDNDILFIDSTHVSKTGSDLNYLFFEVIPRLKKGVKIHFHDIFYPFEYPKDWVLMKKRSWNEAYLLRAFLSYNKDFKILAFNTYLQEFYEDWFKLNMPICLNNTGGSIWIEVVKE